MSIDANPHIENELTPLPADAPRATPRAKNIASQIARGWNAMTDEERQRWRAATEAMNAASSEEPVQLHFQPRELPTDREFFVDELLSADSAHWDLSRSSTRVVEARDLPTTPIPIPALTGSAIPPPWRLPGALSDGLENVPLGMSPESERQIEAVEAALLTYRRPEVGDEIEINIVIDEAEGERLAEARRRRQQKKTMQKMSRSWPKKLRRVW